MSRAAHEWPWVPQRQEAVELMRELLTRMGDRVCGARLGGDLPGQRCAPDAPQPCLGCRIERYVLRVDALNRGER